MRFQGLDLNLLVALDELLRERNLTAAASRLNLSQPAMSAALARLRAYFGDELFRVQARSMVPTPLAESLATPTRDALMQIKAMLARRDAFDPATSHRCFRVALSDYAMLILFTSVVARIAAEAPNITFDFAPFDDTPDELIRRSEVDFLIFPGIFLSQTFPQARLFEDRLVAIVWEGNRMVGTTLSSHQYMSMGHVASQFGRSQKPSIEDWLMLEHGVKRRIEVAVQSFAMVPHLLVETNRVGTMCKRHADQVAKTLPVRVLDLPIPLPSFTEVIQWSPVHNGDPAAEWVRSIILDEAERLK